MHLREAINTRRTAHKWNPTPVPEKVLFDALEAAQMAPCHRLTWPWRFTIPGPDVRQNSTSGAISRKTGTEPTDSYRPWLRNVEQHLSVSQLISEGNQRKRTMRVRYQNLCLSVTVTATKANGPQEVDAQRNKLALLNIPSMRKSLVSSGLESQERLYAAENSLDEPDVLSEQINYFSN